MLIDKDEAIRAICKVCYAQESGDYKECKYYPCDDVQALESLPSTDVERIKVIMKEANEKDKAEHMGRPTDLISRADAIAFINSGISLDTDADREYATEMLKNIPSAEAVKVAYICDGRKCDSDCIECFRTTDIEHAKGFELVGDTYFQQEAEAEPTVIRSRTFMPTKDFKEWAKRIREENPNAVVIPCDAEVVSAEAVQGWIPCSERLPKGLEAVNVTWVNHNPPCYYIDIMNVPFTATGVYHDGKWYWWDATVIDLLGEYGGAYIHGIEPIDKDIEVTAWMPLPNPYKGGDSE